MTLPGPARAAKYVQLKTTGVEPGTAAAIRLFHLDRPEDGWFKCWNDG